MSKTSPNVTGSEASVTAETGVWTEVVTRKQAYRLKARDATRSGSLPTTPFRPYRWEKTPAYWQLEVSEPGGQLLSQHLIAAKQDAAQMTAHWAFVAVLVHCALGSPSFVVAQLSAVQRKTHVSAVQPAPLQLAALLLMPLHSKVQELPGPLQLTSLQPSPLQ
jgi:hypothetical protein